MMERVKTVLFTEQLKTSGSYPCKFACDNGKVYIVKHSENGKNSRELINEWFGSAFAMLCGVAVPPTAVVEIMPDSIPIDFDFQRMIPRGIGFGSEMLIDSKNINEFLFRKQDLSKFAIPEQLLRIIIFDVWLHNNDRTVNNQNVLVYQTNKRLSLYAIDHTRIFNDFQYPMLRRDDILNEPPTLYDTLLPYKITIHARQSLALFFEPILEEILQEIITIPQSKIEELFSTLPVEYSLSNDEQDILLQYITKRQHLLGDFLTELVRE